MAARNVVRRPVVAEAWQFLGTVADARDILQWAGENSNLRAVISAGSVRKPFIEVDVDGGVVTAGPTDWIIKSKDTGRFRVMNDEKFQTEYMDAP